MAVINRNQSAATSDKKRPVLYLVTPMTLKSGDTITRKLPIWENTIENDNLMCVVVQKVKDSDEQKFQPNGQTYWYEGVPEARGITAADLA